MPVQEFVNLPENVAFFLTSGFEEGTAVFCIDKLREAGLPVSLIGINDQAISGLHGIKIEPDFTIDDIANDSPFRLIVISGGSQTITSLLFDPRIDEHLKQTIKSNGYIAPIAHAKELLEAAGFFDDESASALISQEDHMNVLDFANEVVKIAMIEANQPDLQQ